MAPNIIVVLTDDHGQWATGCYGNREIHTPTLDNLAATGVTMLNAFTPSPVCSPARACFFTGLFPSQHGVHDWIHPDFEEPAWLNRPTIAHILQENGYTTALCGKWHLGQNQQPQQGFDYWSAVDRNYPPKDGVYINDVGEAIQRRGYNTQLITDDAVDFLRSHETDKPFFLFVGYFGTHSPWSGHPERLVEQYRNCTFDNVPDGPVYSGGRLTGESLAPTRLNRSEALAQYYASVTHIDEGVGRILDELDAQRLRDDTLIVYTADHGLNCGQHGIWGKGNGTRPLNMLEESIRIPLIVNCPGTRGDTPSDNRIGMKPGSYNGWVLGGQRRTEFVDHTDLFTTLLDYAGVPPVDDSPGRSFLPMLQAGKGLPDWKDSQIAEYGPVRMIRTEKYKLVLREPSGKNELYDLDADPAETRNLYTAELAVELTTRLEAFFEAYATPDHDGRNAERLRQHNYVEAWRGEIS
ncbi:MAG: sulfatase-like hydrolase/transferase [Aggregatilineales bacterium]